MSATNGDHLWYAIQVKSRHEKVAALSLTHKRFDLFLPLYSRRNAWTDRIKEVQYPLFPGYLFCRIDLGNRLPILTAPGVIRIVGIGDTPCPVDEAEVATIQRIVSSGLSTKPADYLRAGQLVRLTGGPLSGSEGILLSVKNSYRLLVSISILQRSVTVEIERDWVEPVGGWSCPVGRFQPGMTRPRENRNVARRTVA